MQIPEYENYHETKSHSTPDFPYNAYICSIPLDFEKVPLHWHDEVEIIYIKKGRGRVTLDFTSLYVEAGDIIIVSPVSFMQSARLNILWNMKILFFHLIFFVLEAWML